MRDVGNEDSMANGADAKGNFHDTDGQFVSLKTLVERERQDHAKEHERGAAVAKETAQRMEREVEETAKRLERAVEETAARLDKAVSVALKAVADTAQVHSDAHAKEHAGHERIHAVEKIQVDKAEGTMNRRLEGMNEFRSALTDQSSKFVSRELFDALAEKLAVMEKRVAYYAGAAAAVGAITALIMRLVGTP